MVYSDYTREASREFITIKFKDSKNECMEQRSFYENR